MTWEVLPRDLRRALDRLEAEPERRWTLATLAAASDVAPRTLQRHFRRFLGRTPLAFVRELRLEKARQLLLRASATTSVSDVAARCGFNHLGRFAACYQRRHGEAPSATLRRSQPTPAPRTPLRPILSAAIERPAIAVLPFGASGTDAGAAVALADEIAGALWRRHWFHVTAPESARYHLRGRIAAEANGLLRAAVLLSDVATSRVIWADKWSGDRDDLLAFEERVAAGVGRAIEPALREAEIDRAARGDPDELGAWSLTMRALGHVLSFEPAALGVALEQLERAIERAPHDALPLAVAAWCHGLRAGHHFTAQREQEKESARALAARAARLNAADPLASTMLACGYTLAHDLDAAEVHLNRALILDGGSAWAWGRRAWIKAYRGEAAEAIECFNIARELAPLDRLDFLCCHGIASAMFDAGRYGEAIFWFRQGITENPAARWIGRWLVAAYMLAGREEEGRHTLAELRNADPELTIADLRRGLPWHSGFLDRVAEGLAAAGMPP